MADSTPARFDAVVVGAGPAGSAAAYHLAHRGRRVLLVDRRAFPRDKCCGDALTPAAVRLLAGMGALDELAGAWRTVGVRLRRAGLPDEEQRFPDPPGHGLVLTRRELDRRLAARAVRAGAVFWPGIRATYLLGEPGRVRGVEVEGGGRRLAVRVPVVVAADGAASALARQAGLGPPDRRRSGFAVRGYFAGVTGLDELVEVRLPLGEGGSLGQGGPIAERAPTGEGGWLGEGGSLGEGGLVGERDRGGRDAPLSWYGWVCPVREGLVNVGVGMVDPPHRQRVRARYERLVAELLDGDERFRRARATGVASGGLLRFDFAPRRCGLPGLLVAGDAAGVGPTIGVGIGSALESGRLAAERIDAALGRGEESVDPGPYAAQLRRSRANPCYLISNNEDLP
ncbi:FAD-dependent oxidoreductase [Micromonospora sp. NPDC049559]|uniref:NAD(P)/FAD-dependent oxidoreductase n=1 Tax=Micromonospora sp. NPDC049559 TaxID=3155923 RepID=UPI00342D1734